MKIAALRERSIGPFDQVPTNDETWEREQEKWRRWEQDLESKRRDLAAVALTELATRDGVTRRGRRATLAAYKEYKRRFLSKWARCIEGSARTRYALNQDELAARLGFGGARQWRIMKSGATGTAGGCYRATEHHFNKTMVPAAQKQGWHRRGNIFHIWALQTLMSPSEFEAWAATVLPR